MEPGGGCNSTIPLDCWFSLLRKGMEQHGRCMNLSIPIADTRTNVIYYSPMEDDSGYVNYLFAAHCTDWIIKINGYSFDKFSPVALNQIFTREHLQSCITCGKSFWILGKTLKWKFRGERFSHIPGKNSSSLKREEFWLIFPNIKSDIYQEAPSKLYNMWEEFLNFGENSITKV